MNALLLYLACTIFPCATLGQDRLRLGYTQINLVYLSPCTIFAGKEAINRA